MNNTNATTIYVGAGPCGLWTAVQHKLLNPSAEIEVIEKFEKYQRSHHLMLHASSLAGIPADPRLKAIVKEFLTNKQVRTNTVEEKLANLARELGIGIRKSVHVTDPISLRTLYPKAKIIVGSDGAHSVVRKMLFKNEMRVDKHLNFIVDVKYEVKGHGKPLSLKELYPTLKAMKSLAQEYVGREKDGVTPITLRLFVKKEEFESMRGATFKNPYTFENEEHIHAHVLDNITMWMNLKAKSGENLIEGSEKISVTPLGYYASQHVVKHKEGLTMCLVGDAAFGVPFFRSLNNGFLSGTELAKVLSKVSEMDPKDPKVAKIFNVYASFVYWLSFKEILWARIKNFFLSCVHTFVYVSSNVPWQINYWTEAKIKILKTKRASQT